MVDTQSVVAEQKLLHAAHFHSFESEVDLSESFAMTFAVAISKSSCAKRECEARQQQQASAHARLLSTADLSICTELHMAILAKPAAATCLCHMHSPLPQRKHPRLS